MTEPQPDSSPREVILYPLPGSKILPLAFTRDHVLAHEGPCGERVRCWRPECLAHWGDIATVEVLPSGERLARCHGARHAMAAAS